jgi:hypothetical protein
MCVYVCMFVCVCMCLGVCVCVYSCGSSYSALLVISDLHLRDSLCACRQVFFLFHDFSINYLPVMMRDVGK